MRQLDLIIPGFAAAGSCIHPVEISLTISKRSWPIARARAVSASLMKTGPNARESGAIKARASSAID
jgi:hypothetical protein